jgi:ABC-type sulfate transport system substrate-binding protein
MAPDIDAVHVMTVVDSLAPDYRALVHEFGVTIVTQIMDEAGSVAEAREMLNYWRNQRQEQWLSTNYVTRSMFRKAA